MSKSRHPHPRPQHRHHDTGQPASGPAAADRSLGAASVLVAAPSLAPRLTDIVEAIENIRSETAGVSLDVFEADWRKRWLVERGIEIISEASRRLRDELKARHPEIPWRRSPVSATSCATSISGLPLTCCGAWPKMICRLWSMCAARSWQRWQLINILCRARPTEALCHAEPAQTAPVFRDTLSPE